MHFMGFKSKFRVLLIIPAIFIGVAILAVSVKSKKGPDHSEIKERAALVRVIPVSEVTLSPRAVGHGLVQPSQDWKAVSEVSGKIVAMHPELKKGSIIAKDTVLFRIDPESYDLAQVRSEADIQALQAQFGELEQTEANLKRLLEVETQSLRLSKNEFERRRSLYANRSVSRNDLEKAQQAFLAQQTKVQNIQNSLNLIPTQKNALQAQIASSHSRAEDSRLNLEKTVIKAPFHCRISAVNVEKAQFAAAGQVLVEADDISTAEILAQVPITSMYMLHGGKPRPIPMTDIDMDKLRDFLGMKAKVRLHISTGLTVEWKARFSRPAETIDPLTRTIGLYVEVDDPYLKAKIGERPPLVKNMYCEVELIGRPVPDVLVIPRSALHQGVVYVARPDNRLERRRVQTGYKQGHLVVVEDGLSAGERVVVTDVIPAVEGMLLNPVTDDALLESLRAEAAGEGPVK